jgi:hypothetical protein
MCSARPNWLSLSTRFFDKKACHQISLPLYDILQLDTVKMTVTCEPMVTVGMVTKYLIPKGFTLAVTLEIGGFQDQVDDFWELRARPGPLTRFMLREATGRLQTLNLHIF